MVGLVHRAVVDVLAYLGHARGLAGLTLHYSEIGERGNGKHEKTPAIESLRIRSRLIVYLRREPIHGQQAQVARWLLRGARVRRNTGAPD